MIERERCGHVVHGRVDLSCSSRDIRQMPLDSSIQFFDITNTHGSSGGRAESVVTVELQVDGVLKALPFLIREQLTPLRIALWQNGLA